MVVDLVTRSTSVSGRVASRSLAALILVAAVAAGLAGCATMTSGIALTPQAECVRAGGAWMSTGCEHAAGGGGM
jgi:hypothetical protein